MKTGLFLLAGFILAVIFLAGCTQPPVACTADAKICPDGSAVGRAAPNCDFAPCPQAPACKAEGQTIPVIPNPPACCSGLTLIPPKTQLEGISGICTAKCGNGTCDTQTESTLNCPQDCNLKFCSSWKDCTAVSCNSCSCASDAVNKNFVAAWRTENNCPVENPPALTCTIECEAVPLFCTNNSCSIGEIPRTKEQCEAENGSWQTETISSSFSCNFKTNDFGKACSNSSECEGPCFADSADAVSGYCSEFRTDSSCHMTFENGKAVQIACPN